MKILTFIVFFLFFESAYSVETLAEKIHTHCVECVAKLDNSTGAYILEYGEEALMSRAWLAQNASKTIDVQYFIWSTDNIGILASEALLSAAERGVKVRVLVDDLLVDAADKTLLSLAAHPNVEIRIYNPKNTVGTSTVKRAVNVITNFRGVNQRMHDKTAIFDNVVGITGGRNMADEYFDYDQVYNFRDRDILLLGKAVTEMTVNFEEFWVSELSVPVESLLGDSAKHLTDTEIQAIQHSLHEYAANTENFEPEIRQTLAAIPADFPALVKALEWDDAIFISDIPGKNSNTFSLSGGGESTSFLVQQLANAQQSVLIQSPYLIFPDGGIELLTQLVKKGVKVRISSNSLASTDNVMAFSGYQNQRKQLLKAGVELYEFKPHPEIQANLLKRYPRLKDKNPIFAIHAKSMVIDGQKIFIGTFNLDPRSANLNTEVGVFIDNTTLAKSLTDSIQRDIHSENSWHITEDFNPDGEVSAPKQIKSGFYRILPMKKVL
jgi:putative cardiolipin synthase